MAFAFFQIPARGCPTTVAELNRFLQNHRVLTVDRRWVDQGENSYWAICVDYLEAGSSSSGSTSQNRRGRVDYREVLAPEEFELFASLRELRKQLATDEGVPVYAVFTNEQLAQMVQRKVTSIAQLKQIEGLGDAKSSKYGEAMLKLLVKQLTPLEQIDEASQSSVREDS